MWHRIARRIGCTVAEAQSRMDAAEYVEWCAEYAMEPWDDGWRQAGTIAAAIVNANLRRGVRSRTPDDFIPRAIKPQRKQSIADMISVFEASAQ